MWRNFWLLCTLFLPTGCSQPVPVLNSYGLPCFSNLLGTVIHTETLENGFDVAVLDFDQDKKPDAVTYTSAGSKRPMFYELDVDADNEPDLLYIDTKQDGGCDGINLYRDYRQPGEAHSPAEQPPSTNEGI